MAERGAHLTQTVHNVPSVFDVLAADGLLTSLRAGGLHLLKVLASHYPAQCGVLHRWGEEIVSLLHALVEAHFLSKHGGSFAEHFYGMKRVDDAADKSFLSARCRKLSLLLLVVVPYIRVKMAAWYEKLRYDSLDGSSYRGVVGRLRWLYTALYPYLHCAWEGSGLALLLRFALYGGSIHSPALWLSGARLVLLTEEDIQGQQDDYEWASARLADHTLRPMSRAVLAGRLAVWRVASALGTGLSVAAFLLQFLAWHHSASEERGASDRSQTLVPPPTGSSSVKGDGERAGSETTRGSGLVSLCPLCSKPRTNDTALSVSGYVFCYPCIFQHVSKHRCCPMTQYPATSDQLIRLYRTEG